MQRARNSNAPILVGSWASNSSTVFQEAARKAYHGQRADPTSLSSLFLGTGCDLEGNSLESGSDFQRKSSAEDTSQTPQSRRTVASGDGLPNSSSPQGEIFYSQITAGNSPQHYGVYSVDGCTGAEVVYGGNVSAVAGNPQGISAIEEDMAGGTMAGGTLAAQCFHGFHQN
jgi:hypothetical protein